MEVLHPRCAGLDVHKETVVTCVRIVSGGEVSRAVRTFETTTARLIELAEWLEANGCTHVAMEATGVYWKPGCRRRRSRSSEGLFLGHACRAGYPRRPVKAPHHPVAGGRGRLQPGGIGRMRL
jgi:hypothetical protein